MSCGVDDMAKKPEILYEPRIVTYSLDQWATLTRLRTSAMAVMTDLTSQGLNAFVYGSVARGDVTESSDIDLILMQPLSSYKIEVALDRVLRRELVQATPSMVLKGHLYLEDDIVITFPLFKLRPREEEFYRWGGLLDIGALERNERMPGVDKRLLLIEPTQSGHIESGVIGNEAEVSRKLNLSTDIAHERVRVLTRRDEVGRTGVYLSRILSEDESFEEVAKGLVDRDPALRRTIERREGRR